MKNKNLILSATLAAVFSASTAFAEAEVTGKIVHESGFFSEAGSTIGDYGVGTVGTFGGAGATSGDLNTHSENDAMKRETSARIYVDGEIDKLADGATYHVELNLMTDGEGVGKYDSHESYTQRDGLREAYVDSQVGDWSLRTGKQQVVWGTADGMKLLDMINPTDYSEMAQNQMEDSRIPVWMVNAEKTLEDGSEFQVIVSQPKENIFPGLNRHVDTGVRQNRADASDSTVNNGTDTGHAFMMKGPDTITGVHNGFLNIAPDLMGVAAAFAGGFGGGGELSSASMANFNVNLFENMKMGGATDTGLDVNGNTYDTLIGGASYGENYRIMASAMYGSGMLCDTGTTCTVSTSTNVSNTEFTEFSTAALLGTAIDDSTAASNSAWLLPDNFLNAISKTMAAYSPDTRGFDGNVENATGTIAGVSFTKALNAITGAYMLQNGFASAYDTNLADAESSTEVANNAFDYMQKTTFYTFDAFVGGNSQYVYNMPTDSEVDLATRFKNTTKGGVNYSLNASYNYDKNPIIDMSWRNAAGTKLHTNKVWWRGTDNSMTVDNATTTSGYSLILSDSILADGVTVTNGNYGGAASLAAGASKAATLRFTQEVKRVANIGGSFDMAIETAALGPVVIRGEGLYTKGVYNPIIDKDKLSHGDLVGALEMVKGDRFKYVLGADITVLTNMMVSAQYIEDRNLDFVDGANRYTADYSTMSMTNGFNKAIESKNFYSLFLSKPFGASGEHRWNNIVMLEESANGDGKWNRLDAEFSIDDDTQATVEWNKYWGDANSQFGQLDKSSNIQVGVKYSF